MRASTSFKLKAAMAFVSSLALAVSFAASAQCQEIIFNYLDKLESEIANNWRQEMLPKYKIPSHFQQYAKGVVSFCLDSRGNLSRVKLRHSSKESLIIAARLRYGERGDALLAALDKSMLEAVKNSSPLPAPPKQLESHQRLSVIFDPQRFKVLRVFIDDNIPVKQGLSTGRLQMSY